MSDTENPNLKPDANAGAGEQKDGADAKLNSDADKPQRAVSRNGAKPKTDSVPVTAVITQPIIQSRHTLTEVVSSRHSISPEAGTPFEDVLKPGYYSNIAHKLRPTDIIEVRPEEGSYYAELIVWGAGKSHANVSVVKHVERPENMTTKIIEGFEVEFRAGPAMYRVIRTSDQKEIKSGFANPDDATDWLIANRRQFAA